MRGPNPFSIQKTRWVWHAVPLFTCMIANQNSEIHNLMNIIRDLNASIVLLTEAITLLQSSVNIATQSSIPEQTTSNTSTSLKTPSEASINFSANIPPKPPPAVSERRSKLASMEYLKILPKLPNLTAKSTSLELLLTPYLALNH